MILWRIMGQSLKLRQAIFDSSPGISNKDQFFGLLKRDVGNENIKVRWMNNQSFAKRDFKSIYRRFYD